MPTSDRDTIVFADRDTLFPNVTVDGFFDRDFMITNEAVETGYVGGALMTLGSSGIAPVVFQGVRADNDRLVMAFLCRFSDGTLTQAEDDELFIGIKSSFASSNVNDVRLIRVNPRGGGGAIGGAGVNGATGVANDIRANRDGRVEEIFKPDGAGSWTNIAPTNVDIKVRTWRPEPVLSPNNVGWSVEVSIPRLKSGANGGGSDWIDIQNHFGFCFAVYYIVPIGGGAASQYLFPLNATGPFVGFSTLLALSEIPFGHGLIPGVATPPLTETAKGVYFMGDWQGIGRRTFNPASPDAAATPGALGHEISASNNQIVALLGNDGTNNAGQVQVDFAFAHWGLPSGDPNLWTRPEGLLPIKIPAGGRNVAAAATNVVFASDSWTLDNNPANHNYKGSGLTQQGFFAAHTHQCMWAQATALAGGVNFRQSSVRRNMDFVGLSEVERDAVVSGEGYEKPANGTAEHDFILQTFCRHIPVQSVVENIKNVEDGTKLLLVGALEQKGRDGDDQPGVNADTHMRAMVRGTHTQYKDDLVLVWVTLGYRTTKHTVISGGKRYPLLDNGSGSFGFVAYHGGVEDNFSWQLSGSGLGSFGPGLYGLKVPHKGEATIRARISCEPRGPFGDDSKELPKLDPDKWVPRIDRDLPPGDNPKPDQPGGTGDHKGGCASVIVALIALPALWAASHFLV
jgi:hypothetical protein